MRLVARARRSASRPPRRTGARAALLDRAVAELFMRGALREAAKGLGRTSPNPAVGAVLVNVVYFPAKVLFAGAGAVTSGLAYVVTGGETQPATKIWDTSVKGNYVMTPSMVEGEAPVHFTGNA